MLIQSAQCKALMILLILVTSLIMVTGCSKKDEPNDPSYYKGSDFKKGPGKSSKGVGDN